jgi:outer membrane protein OmpA-like peptidoglycan-associated protein
MLIFKPKTNFMKTKGITKISLLLLGGLLFAGNTFAQLGETNYKGWSITLKGGVMSPYTDIRTFDFARVKEGDLTEWKFGGGLNLTYMFSSPFGIQGEFLYGQLLGIATANEDIVEDQNTYDKLGFLEPVYFSTNIMHGGANLYVDFNSLAIALKKANHKPNSNRRIGIYGTVGIGLSLFNSEIRSVSTDTLYENPQIVETDFGPQRIGGYLRGFSGDATEMDFPMSLGIKYKLSRSFDLGLQATMYNTFTDKLDAYVQNVNNIFKKNNDKYFFSGLTITYKFVGKDKNNEYIEWMDPSEKMYDEFGEVKDMINKLSKDADNDGVSDMFDKEPNTPAGYKVYGSGESVDSDKDGVADGKDRDLFSPMDCGVNADGIPADDDGDGVPNCLDKEKSTPAGNMVNFQGVSIPKPTAGSGYVLPTVYFDTDKSDIKSMYYPELAALASTMKANANMKIVLTGHADERATDQYNQGLGQRRADGVKDHLVKYYGVDGARIETVSKGESTPVFRSLYSLNRRVEVSEKK